MSPEDTKNKKQSPVSLIILDCDGVLLESVSAKTDAFRTLFSFVPDKVDEIVAFHLENGGMSRFDKFRYIYANILNKDLSKDRFDKLSDNFSSIVYQKVMESPFVNGAAEFLEKYHTKIPLYVVSATPEQELLQIFRERDLLRFFKAIYGSPEKKVNHIATILQTEGIEPRSAYFVGDAKNDYDAAMISQVRFIARIRPGDPDRFEGLTGIDGRIKDLTCLKCFIDGLLC
jgi:phosphoglycolate phosphatase-like HAD superfamily hydrolase